MTLILPTVPGTKRKMAAPANRFPTALRPTGFFPATFFELIVIRAKNTPSVRAIRFPFWLAASEPEHIKNTTPMKITSTGRKLLNRKRWVRSRPTRKSQMVAVYCIPMATGAEVAPRARMMLMQRPV